MALLKSAHGGNIREAAALMGISAAQLLILNVRVAFGAGHIVKDAAL